MIKKSMITSVISKILAVTMIVGLIPMTPMEAQAAVGGRLAEAMGSYEQDMNADPNTLQSESNGAVTIKFGEGGGDQFLGGKSLYLTSGADYRSKLLYFTDGWSDSNTGVSYDTKLKDGIYEVSFRTTDTIPSSIGFLARYKDEQSYAGLSIDGKGTNWEVHYSKGSARGNDPFAADGFKLKPNTSYRVKLIYNGDKISVAAMNDGDQDYTTLVTNKLMDSLCYTGEGGFALRVYGGTVIFDNIIQKDIDGKTVRPAMTFDNGNDVSYEAYANRSLTPANGQVTLAVKDSPNANLEEPVDGFALGTAASKVVSSGAAVYVDRSAPAVAKGNLEVTFNGTSSQFGVVFRCQDSLNYVVVGYDGTFWSVSGKNGGQEVSIPLGSVDAPLTSGKAHRIGVDYCDPAVIKLSVDGTVYELGELKGVFAGKGGVGIATGTEPQTLYLKPLMLSYEIELEDIPDPAEGTYITLKSDEMAVLAGSDFPFVYKYKSGDESRDLAYGNFDASAGKTVRIWTERPDNSNNDVSIRNHYKTGGTDCAADSELVSNDGSMAVYRVTAAGDGIKAIFTVELAVEGNFLTMTVTDVEEEMGTVRMFSFPGQELVSLAGPGAGAALGIVNAWGPAADRFIQLRNLSAADTVEENMVYALLYDEFKGTSIGVENNAEYGESKYSISCHNDGAGVMRMSLANSPWAWQYYDEIDPREQERPYAKVAVGGDENDDGRITWQDAGITYREIMRKPFGHEEVRNYWMYIAMNMSSQASQPFVRVLDQAKAVSYITDGFGQKIMNKGYQGGGHDDTHGDFDFIGKQQGGVDGFNYLIEEGLKYNIKNGIHINATMTSLDNFELKEENMAKNASGGFTRRGNWLDQYYYVDKGEDIKTGDIERRINDLETAVPDLDFVYVDIYESPTNYAASQFIKYLNEKGLSIGTEALGDLNQAITFAHWNTDLYYPVGGTQSQVLRFVTNGVADLGAPDRALLGSLMPGIADWRNTNRFSDSKYVFYRNNLPTKYLQHFDLQSWVPDKSAVFSDNVRTEVEKEGSKDYLSIYKDELLRAKVDVSSVRTLEDYASKGNPGTPGDAEIFIPWSPEAEDKIYCYNDVNENTVWKVPESWGTDGTAYLYELTYTGRTEARQVFYSGGEIELLLELETPYVLTREKEEQPHFYDQDGSPKADSLPDAAGSWGQGSLIRDFGCTSHTMDAWTVEKDGAGSAEIDLTFKGSNNGSVNRGTPSQDPRVMLTKDFSGSISQKIEVEPGKTYTFSVWVCSEGNRPVTLSVEAGDEVQKKTLATTAGIPVMMKPSKYTGSNYQRLKVDITIPDGVTEATLRFGADAGDQPVYCDDFRSWEWEGSPNPQADKYYYYEDFENLDENWGPFVSQEGGQPRTHLAYKADDPNSTQLKYYTVDTVDEDRNPDETNLTSLKFARDEAIGATNSTMLARTLPSTLEFEKGKEYLVEFDYQEYREIRSSTLFTEDNSVTLDGVTYDEGYYGKSAPIKSGQGKFVVDVRRKDGTIISTYNLAPSTFEDEEITFASRPSTELASIPVNAEEEGIYLTICTKDADYTCILALDNFRVSEEKAGIRIGSLPDKLTYQIGEELDTTGLKVVLATSSNAVPVELSEDEYTVSELDSSKAGRKEITVTYKAEDGSVYSAAFYVTVVLEDRYYTTKIEVTKLPDKTKYTVGDEFDAAGMVVEAVKKASPSNAEPIREVIKDYEAVWDFSKPGKSRVTVLYEAENADGDVEEFTDSFEVTVEAFKRYYTDRIYVDKQPDKKVYKMQESFDPAGMRVMEVQKATPGNAVRECEIPLDDLEYVYDFTSPGTQTVKVRFYGYDKNEEEKAFTASVKVRVADEAPEGIYTTGIEVASQPDKKVYNLGESFDRSGMTVLAHRQNSGTGESWTEEITDYEAAPSIFMAAGSSVKVTVSYTAIGKEGTAAVFTDFIHVQVNKKSSSSGGSSSSYYGQTAVQVSSPSSIMDGGCWVLNQGTWQFQKKSGQLARSEWGKINGVWYFFKADASMAVGQWVMDGGQWYCVAENGAMLENTWLFSNNRWYYLGQGGRMLAGTWLQYEDDWYYLTGNGSMAIDMTTPDGYRVGPDGKWLK